MVLIAESFIAAQVGVWGVTVTDKRFPPFLILSAPSLCLSLPSLPLWRMWKDLLFTCMHDLPMTGFTSQRRLACPPCSWIFPVCPQPKTGSGVCHLELQVEQTFDLTSCKTTSTARWLTPVYTSYVVCEMFVIHTYTGLPFLNTHKCSETMKSFLNKYSYSWRWHQEIQFALISNWKYYIYYQKTCIPTPDPLTAVLLTNTPNRSFIIRLAGGAGLVLLDFCPAPPLSGVKHEAVMLQFNLLWRALVEKLSLRV